MLLTKHCRPEDRRRMLEGSFRLGTHRDYSRIEQTATGLLSDKDEGRGHVGITGDLQHASFYLAQRNVLVNDLTAKDVGDAWSIRFGIEEDASLFCSSFGPYNSYRHHHILNGWEGYSPNPDSRAFVVLDYNRLKHAICILAEEVYKKSFCFDGLVCYGRRHIGVTGEQLNPRFSEMFSQMSLQVAFTKPEVFSPEEEYRIAVFPEGESAKVHLTQDRSEDIQRAFAQSIENEGADYPS